MALEIKRIVDPEDPLLTQVYELFASQFGADELDPLDVTQEELELTKKGDHDAPYILEASQLDGELIGAIAGNLFRLSEDDKGAAAIGYCAVDPNIRKRGVGKNLVDRFHQTINQSSREEGRQQVATVLEAETPDPENPNRYNSIPFWDRLGWKLTEGGIYKQPSLEFNEDGTPTYSAVPLAFMVRPAEGEAQDMIARPTLKDIVGIMFDNWYVPELEKQTAQKRAAGHVYGIMGRFLQSVHQDEQGMVPLVPYQAGEK